MKTHRVEEIETRDRLSETVR